MATVFGRAAHVVDGARSFSHLVGKRLDLVESARDERRNRSRGTEGCTEVTVDTHRERDDRDHHRIAWTNLHEGLAALAGVDGDAENQLVVGERVLLRTDEEVLQRNDSLASHARELHA